MSRWGVATRRTWIVFAAAVAGVVSAGIVLSVWPLGDWRRWLPDLLAGWAFLVSGALIGGRPGGARQGGLVAGVGAAWFVADVVPQLAVLHWGVLVHAAVA